VRLQEHSLVIAAALALACAPAPAQTVYRCGDSYGTQPCAGGKAFDASDARTPADAAQAGKVAAADAKRADAMEKARLAQEKNAPKAIVIGGEAKPQEKAAKPEAKTKGKGKKNAAGPEHFTAVAPRKK
jgi:hypothetical protein